VNYSHRSPKGNRHMRRILNQSANAAVKAKGSTFEIVYRRTVPRMGHNQTIGTIAYQPIGDQMRRCAKFSNPIGNTIQATFSSATLSS